MTQEGVIRFDLDYRPARLGSWPWLAGLDGWRVVLRRLGLLGQDPARYEGFGFGNLSHRLGAADEHLHHATGTLLGKTVRDDAFVISGSQTGHLESLGVSLEDGGWSLVADWDVDAFRVVACGPAPPSAESLTHAMVYELDPEANCVVHVHSPELWAAAARLDLPTTHTAADYGTPEMTAEVRRLFLAGVSDVGLFAMGGHEDGLVVFGADADDACGRLLQFLARALSAS